MELSEHKVRFRILFVLDLLLLLITQVIQGAALNYYLIKQFEEYFTVYFLFIVDFFCLCVFVGTFIVSYNHFIRTPGNAVEERKKYSSIEKRLPRSKYGVLPLCYISWLFYALILVAKLAVIFHTNAVLKVQDDHNLGSHILQVK